MTDTSQDHGLPQLARLERQLRRELDLLCLPAKPWVHPRSSNGEPVVDVLVVGAGVCGLTATAALHLLGVNQVRVIDRAPSGAEGPWVTFARMQTLRSPKILAGPALGLPSLTFRAWFEALFGTPAWDRLDKIARPMWMDYLNWYRSVLGIAVDNDTALTAICGRDDGMLDVLLQGPHGEERVTARRVVLANGRDGLGGAYVPAIAASLPRTYWSHTSDAIDFDALRGQRVAVIGAGASAMDNAATALERGAASVDLFVRRTDIPRINKLTGISNPGLVHGFLGLADEWKWKLQSYSISTHPPPPRDSTLRVSHHANARFHVGSPLLSLSIDVSGAVALATPKGNYQLDHIIFGTGFCQDLALRPELAALAPHVKRWQERYPAGAEHGPAELRESPDLGPIFEFQSKGAPQPGLSSIHCFNYAAMLSHGKVSGDIPAVSTGAQRLATGIAERFFQEDIALHYRDMENYDVAELQGDEWTDADA